MMLGPQRKHALGEPIPATKPRRKNEEANIQMRVVKWLRDRGEPVVRVEEARKLTPQAAERARRLGAFPGFTDLLLFCRMIAVELKTTRGRVSDTQRACHDLMRAGGWTIVIPFGYDDCIKQLEVLLARSTRP